MEKDLRANYTASAMSFATIGTDGMKLSQIKLTGVPNRSEGVITIAILDELGSPLKTYKYYKGGRNAYATEGWYYGSTLLDGSDADHEVVLEKGTGVWFKGIANLKFTASGEVLTGDLPIALRVNYTLVANPYAAPLKVSQIKLTGVPNRSEGVITIGMLDELGSPLKTYKYYKGGRNAYATEGWYYGSTLLDGSDADHEALIPAGEAMWFKGVANLSATLTCPYTLSEKAAE